MSHPDPTTLALAALGEPISPDEREHVASCPTCAADLADLGAVVVLGREAPEELPAVPQRVWAGVREELGLGGARHGLLTREASSTSTRPDPAPVPRPTGGGTGGEEIAEVVPLGPRRRAMSAVAAVAASVGAMVGGAAVWATIDRPAPDAQEGVVVAQAVLDPLSATVTSAGSASVLDSPDGQVIRVDARGLPEGPGFYEVWLIDPGVTKLVALGALPSGSIGTFTVPPGVSVADFPVVDISLEPYDGNPGHSHDSLMRGILDA